MLQAGIETRQILRQSDILPHIVGIFDFVLVTYRVEGWLWIQPVKLWVYIYIYVYYKLNYFWSDNLACTAWEYRNMTPGFPRLEIETATTECRAESLPLNYWTISHTSFAKLTIHGKRNDHLNLTVSCSYIRSHTADTVTSRATSRITHSQHHTHTHTHIYMYVYVCVCVCLRVYVCVHVFVTEILCKSDHGLLNKFYHVILCQRICVSCVLVVFFLQSSSMEDLCVKFCFKLEEKNFYRDIF